MSNDVDYEGAIRLLISWIKNPTYGMHSFYGYDIYLPSLAYENLNVDNMWFARNSQFFYEAAWELCRRGILRPGVTSHLEQATNDGSSGNGYSITSFGKKWVSESEHDDFVPTEPERFAEMLEQYKDKFGPGFHQRAQQAIRCYGAHTYLATCVMCGAAAESIILAIAVQILKDEQEVLKKYRAANGRNKIENLVTGKQRQTLKDQYQVFNALLKYWRDEASHGRTSEISENEAYTALVLLLRLAIFASDNWVELSAPVF